MKNNKLKGSIRVYDECYDPEINGLSNFSEIWESCKPKINTEIPLGQVIIFGTGGEIDTSTEDMKNIFIKARRHK